MLPAGAAFAAHTNTYPNRLAEIAARPSLPPHTVRIGNVRSSMEISGAVGLRSRDQAGLTRFLADVTDRISPAFHQYLTRSEFASRFGASESAVAAVTRVLRSDGLHPSVSSNRILVTFHGDAARVERAFGTGLADFRFSNGRTGWGATSAARLPSAIAGSVSGVVGLDDLVHMSSGIEKAPRVARGPVKASSLPKAAAGAPSACTSAKAQSVYGGVTADQLAHAYGVDGLYSTGDLGGGQTVDIFELEPFLMSDIVAYDKCYFGPNETNTTHVSVTQVDGGPGTGPGVGEASLDVEDVSTIAPDAEIHVYEGPNTTFGSLDAYNAIATADNARVVSTSWGLCESAFQSGSPGTQEVESEIFAETAAQGQSVFAAAGDDGSDDCSGQAPTPTANELSVDDPASQPYVTSVGGTTFTDITEPPTEQVWNDGNDWGAGGGGISDTWAEPSWQADATVTGIANAAGTSEQPCSDDSTGVGGPYNLAGVDTTLPSGTSCRLVPDVTALADEFTGITTYWNGQMSTVGGTSSSTPLWAAMTADMNGSSFCDGTTLGFVSPLLYDVASSGPSDYAHAFNDITVGNNDSLGVGDGTDFPATSGYDLASGLGSPKITNLDGDPGLAQQACALVQSSSNPPTVSGVSPSSGTNEGGTSVTIAGNDFGTTTGAVYVGTQAATVVSWSSTSIAITTPSYNAPQGTVLPAGGTAPVTVVTVDPERSSSLNPTDSVFHYLGYAGGTTPVIDYIGRTAGNATGGYEVDIVGSGFTGATRVTFGGVEAERQIDVNDSNITATVPAETESTTCAFPSDSSICQVEVRVTTPAGTSAEDKILPAYSGAIEFTPSGVLSFTPGTEVVAAACEFDYAPTPDVTSVTPKYGAEEGGSIEDIHGTGFNVLTYFWTDFGDVGPQSSQDYFDLSITPTDLFIINNGDPNLTGPTTEPEAQAITIVTAGGLYDVPSDLFALAGQPTVTSLSTHVGSTEGGGTLTIDGHGLIDVEAVVFADDNPGFGETESTAFLTQSDTVLKIVLPGNLPGDTEAFACTETGCSNENPTLDWFVFGYPGAPVISKISPSSGPAAGSESLKDAVVISGTLLDSPVAVKFGNTEATVFENTGAIPGGGNAYAILVEAPPGKAGSTVMVSVETAGGEATSHGFSNTKSYTYKKSAPSAPRSLTAKGGKKTISSSWTTPSSNGGSPITGYTVELLLKGDFKKPVQKVTVSASTHSYSFTRVAPGVKYTVAVAAKSSLGTGYFASSAVVAAS